MKVRYDWHSVRAYFLNCNYHSKVTLKVLSEDFKIPYQTVRRKAAAEFWHVRRLESWYISHATKPDKT